jgi:ferredoxin
MNEHTTDWVLPQIDPAHCTGCGICVLRCPTGAVELRGNRAQIVRPADCTFCEICESYCPTHAIGRPFVIRFAPDARRDGSPSPHQ